MRYQVDQSGKVEDTAKMTVIAYSNGTQRAVVIPAKVKRQLQEAFRSCGLTRIFVYQVFAVGIYFLLEGFSEVEVVTVDTEYLGRDQMITEIVTKLLIAHRKPVHEINFARIGNRPKAHYAAKDVFDGKKQPQFMVSYREAVEAIKKADGRLRECLSTLVNAQPRLVKKVSHKQAGKSRGRYA